MVKPMSWSALTPADVIANVRVLELGEREPSLRLVVGSTK
jgi:hypothetical protein